MQKVKSLLGQKKEDSRPDSPPPPPIDERMFHADDVPLFRDNDDYWTWRSKFEMFAKSVYVATANLPAALARIFSRFEGENGVTALAWSPNEIIAASWETTWGNLLEYTDLHWLPRRFWTKEHEKWTAMRYTDKTQGQVFVGCFIRDLCRLNQIAKVSRDGVLITDAEAMNTLLRKVPPLVETHVLWAYPRFRNSGLTLHDQSQIIIGKWEFCLQTKLIQATRVHATPVRQQSHCRPK
jgi:hypothetical protein